MAVIIVMLVAIVGGVAATLQSQALSVMTTRAGSLEAVFITYGGGGLAIGLAMLGMRGGNLGDLRGVPWWVYTGGLLGLVVVGSLGISGAQLGLARSLTLFTAALLIVGAAIDHLGWLGASPRAIGAPQAFGIVLVLIGTWLVVR